MKPPKRVAVPVLPDEDGLLPESASHHLVNVMRLKPGRRVVLFDGQGREQDAELVDIAPPRARVQVLGEPRSVPTGPPLTLVLAVLKHQPMDLAIRMATEAGAARILPVRTERTIAKGDRTERWKRILDAASAQSGRARRPELAPVQPLRSAIEALDVPVFAALPGAPPAVRPTGPCAVCIGPAGGFSPAEATWLSERSTPVGLGPHVLRAETAAAVAVALLRPNPPR